MSAFTASVPVLPARATASVAGRQLRSSVQNGSKTVAKLSWCPGGQGKLNPSYLDGSLPGCARGGARGGGQRSASRLPRRTARHAFLTRAVFSPRD
jgi:hypothetical protein